MDQRSAPGLRLHQIAAEKARIGGYEGGDSQDDQKHRVPSRRSAAMNSVLGNTLRNRVIFDNIEQVEFAEKCGSSYTISSDYIL